MHGIDVVPTRAGASPIGRLVASSNATLPSLTMEYGLNAFPLHTDGAHLSRPPDLIFLAASSTDEPSVPTRLLRVCDIARSSEFFTKLGQAIFRVRGIHAGRYVTAAYDGGIRYDPGCMLPLTSDARYVSQLLAENMMLAEAWQWDTSRGHVLVIDNRRALHGRDSVSRPGRTLDRLMVRWE